MQLSAAQCSLGPVKCFPDHAGMASHDVAMCDLKPDTFLTTSDGIGWLQKELAQGSSGECKKSRAEEDIQSWKLSPI